jgi:LysM repeat protein
MFDPSKQPIHCRSHERAIMAIAVVIPGRFGEHRSASQLYARRRLMVTLIVAAIVLVLLVGAGHVVANRGGAPASASAIRPVSAAAPAAPVAANVYIVQAGDTLWSIGQRFHGPTSLADYVDALVSANGGTRLQVSQALALP